LISKLKTDAKVVGIKQSRKAILDGKALYVFLADDADPGVTEPLEALSRERQVPVEHVPAMRTLGSACGISVGAAVAALLK
jgi:large subunit ribosomal protein L7A